MNAEILVHCTVGDRSGAGHLFRCLTLADALQARGFDSTFLLADPAAAAQGWVENRGHRLEAFSSEDPPECGRIIETFRRGEFSFLVMDGYVYGSDHLAELSRAGILTLYMDDMMKLGEYPSALVCNQNFYASPESYRVPDSTRLLLGPRFALIREEFRLGREQGNRNGSERASRLLIAMGGSDPTQQTDKVLRALEGLDRRLEVTVVVGGLNARLAEIQAQARSLRGHQVRVLFSVQHMSKVMATVDLVVSAAGDTSFEFCMMGLTGLVIANSPLQMRIARGLQDRGLFVNLGWYEDVSEDLIQRELASLLEDADRRCAMSQRGIEAVDGQGSGRVATAIEECLRVG